MNKSTLKKLAGFVWVASGVMLLTKGIMMIAGVWLKDHSFLTGIENAEAIPDLSHTTLIIYVVIGLVVGGAKGLFVLSKSAKRNIDRIDRLEGSVKPWQVFGAKFYPLIVVMIGMGLGFRYVAASAEGWKANFSYGGCGAIYIGIGAALFTSSLLYFKKKTVA